MFFAKELDPHRVEEVRLIHHSDRAVNTSAGTTRRRSPITTCSRRSAAPANAYDNSMAESFVDSFKTELIADRVWRTRSQMELAILEYIAWFNNTRLHENLGDRPPREIEELYAVKSRALTTTS
jgi:putative transposase